MCSSDLAYYDNLLKNAEDFAIDQEYQDLSKTYATTKGGNFDEYISFLQTDGADKYGANIPDVVKGYLQIGYNNMTAGFSTPEDFAAMSSNALSKVVDDPITYRDVKFESLVHRATQP